MQFIRRWLARRDRRGSRRRHAAAAFPCPHCGSDVSAGRSSCPACGASDADGWGAEAEGSWEDDAGAGWGDDAEFDYESFVEREFGESSRDRWEPTAKPRRRDVQRLVIWTLILTFAATLLVPLLF